MSSLKNKKRRKKRRIALYVTALLSVIILVICIVILIMVNNGKLFKKVDTSSQMTEETESVKASSQTETTIIEPAPEPQDDDLVLITDYIPDAVIDLRYGTTNNFTKTQIYEDGFQAQMRYGSLKKLMKAADSLRAQGYHIVVWDSYRPVEAQYKLWTVVPIITYVSNPITGNSRHSRGSTIDLTIMKDGATTTAVMPSEFDEFTSLCDREYSDVSEEAKNNSILLEKAMTDAGFEPYSGEWWHYNDLDEYPVVMRDQYSWAGNLEAAKSHSQLIVVAVGYNKTSATLSYHVKNASGVWEKKCETEALLGSNGVGKTKEGDNKTPTGIFSFTKAFGTAANPGVSAFDYVQVNDSHYWVDDSNSKYYNQFVSVNDVTKDWTSAEHIIDYAVYEYALALDYNKTNKPGLGSAIFLHCSSGKNTNGCIAINKDSMKTILSTISSDCAIIIDTPDQIIKY